MEDFSEPIITPDDDWENKYYTRRNYDCDDPKINYDLYSYLHQGDVTYTSGIKLNEAIIVKYEDEDTDKQYTIIPVIRKFDPCICRTVNKHEPDPTTGIISEDSPLARALLGKYIGDRVELKLPHKTRYLTIKNVLEKFECDQETYYFNRDKFYDSNFIEVDKATLQRIAPSYIAAQKNRLNTREDYWNLIRKCISLEMYSLAIDICNDAIGKIFANKYFIAYVMPVITSCYRKLHDPKSAIKAFERYQICHGICNAALLTSVAAAYCDLQDYQNAQKYAGRAYAILNGKCSHELRLVYQRIESERPIPQDIF